VSRASTRGLLEGGQRCRFLAMIACAPVHPEMVQAVPLLLDRACAEGSCVLTQLRCERRPVQPSCEDWSGLIRDDVCSL
jgi:hypothetical protein